MQLAVIVFPKSKNRQIAVLDKNRDGVRVLVMDWPEQLLAITAFLLLSWALWYAVSIPGQKQVFTEAVRVPRATQVVHIKHDDLLRAGDTVLFRGNIAPGMGRIEGLPRQGVKAHGKEGEQFMVLGPTRYYVVGTDGVGQILSRADIRGIVQTRS